MISHLHGSGMNINEEDDCIDCIPREASAAEKRRGYTNAGASTYDDDDDRDDGDDTMINPDDDEAPLLGAENALTGIFDSGGDGNESVDSDRVCMCSYTAIVFWCIATFFVGICILLYSESQKPQFARSQWDSHFEHDCPAYNPPPYHNNRTNKTEKEQRPCVIIGTRQSNLAQIVLPIAIVIVLLVSWYTERPRRAILQFCADNSKSVIAACLTHFIASAMAVALYAIKPGDNNATVSAMLSGTLHDGGGLGEAESWFGPFTSESRARGDGKGEGSVGYYTAPHGLHNGGSGGAGDDGTEGSGLPAFGGFAGLCAKMLSQNEIFNECDWYILVFFYDSVVSVSLTIVMHQYTAKWAKRYKRFEILSRIGDYGAAIESEDQDALSSSKGAYLKRWSYQVLHWVTCAVIVRAINFGVLYSVRTQLQEVATFIGWWACTKKQIETKVWLNIVVLPIAFDCNQFLVQNYFLKDKNAEKKEKHRRSMVYKNAVIQNERR